MNAIIRSFTWAAMFGLLMISPAVAVSTPGSVGFQATIHDMSGSPGVSGGEHYTVAWVTKEDGTFIKTVWRQGTANYTNGKWTRHCATWTAARGASVVTDGYTSATAWNYTAATNNPVAVTWNCQDANGTVVPDGNYIFKVQYAEDGPEVNGPVTSALVWTKGSSNTTVDPADEGTVGNPAGGNNFTNMSIVWTPDVVVPPAFPEIAVEDPDNIDLVDGAAVRNFGSQGVGHASGAGAFTIRNTGAGKLSGLAITKSGSHAADFMITSAPATTVDSGAATGFTVVFKPTAPGVRTAVLHIASNDADENPFDVQLAGTATVAPEIVVEQPRGTKLKSGSAIVKCGPGAVGIAGKRVVFTMWNSGTADLTGIKVSVAGIHAADYLVTKPATTTLAPWSAAIFEVVFKPSAVGTRTATLRIASNDGDENPFVIALTGVASLPAPEIAVAQVAGGDLVDGKAKKSFGTVTIGKAKSKTFIIRNTGTATLKGLAITRNGADKGDFIVTAPAKTSLAAGARTTFKVTFKPGAKGTRSAAIHIRSNDADESPFDIKLAGQGVK